MLVRLARHFAPLPLSLTVKVKSLGGSLGNLKKLILTRFYLIFLTL